MPKAFGNSVRQDLDAASSSVRLRTRSEHFYELALQINAVSPELRLDPLDTREQSLGDLVTRIFEKRYKTLITESVIGGGLALTDPRVMRMTNEERKIHDVTTLSRRALKSWEFDSRKMHAFIDRSRDTNVGAKRQRR